MFASAGTFHALLCRTDLDTARLLRRLGSIDAPAAVAPQPHASVHARGLAMALLERARQLSHSDDTERARLLSIATHQYRAHAAFAAHLDAYAFVARLAASSLAPGLRAIRDAVRAWRDELLVDGDTIDACEAEVARVEESSGGAGVAASTKRRRAQSGTVAVDAEPVKTKRARYHADVSALQRMLDAPEVIACVPAFTREHIRYELTRTGGGGGGASNILQHARQLVASMTAPSPSPSPSPSPMRASPMRASPRADTMETLERTFAAVTFSAVDLRTPHPHVIARLYAGIVCRTCGLRLPDAERLTVHLDTHRRQAKVFRAKTEAWVGKPRGWNWSEAEWVRADDVVFGTLVTRGVAKNDAVTTAAAAASAKEARVETPEEDAQPHVVQPCTFCGDALVSRWNDDAEAALYVDCARITHAHVAAAEAECAYALRKRDGGAGDGDAEAGAANETRRQHGRRVVQHVRVGQLLHAACLACHLRACAAC
jgi:hypothetical protein